MTYVRGRQDAHLKVVSFRNVHLVSLKMLKYRTPVHLPKKRLDLKNMKTPLYNLARNL